MLSPRENALAILNHEQPDYYGDMMDAAIEVPEPVRAADAVSHDGIPGLDAWGVTKVWHPGAPGAHPVCTSDLLVIPDIEEWEKYLKIPSLDGLEWEPAVDTAAKIDRSWNFVCYFMSTGLFERSHFLMGMENAFCNYLEYPDEMADILNQIADYKIKQIEIAASKIHPDLYFYQDDWGSKQNLFLPPDIWRKIIKPIQKRVADAIHSTGALYVHHADCICEPIVEDMVEIGIDVWQGVIPQNDIVAIQEKTQHRLPMVGGIDVPKIDVQGITDEEIRSEVRHAVDTYCPGGRFFPARPSGRCYIAHNNEIMNDELKKYGRVWALEHPIA